MGSDALDGVVMDANSSVTMKSKQFVLCFIFFSDLPRLRSITSEGNSLRLMKNIKLSSSCGMGL